MSGWGTIRERLPHMCRVLPRPFTCARCQQEQPAGSVRVTMMQPPGPPLTPGRWGWRGDWCIDCANDEAIHDCLRGMPI